MTVTVDGDIEGLYYVESGLVAFDLGGEHEVLYFGLLHVVHPETQRYLPFGCWVSFGRNKAKTQAAVNLRRNQSGPLVSNRGRGIQNPNTGTNA